MNDPVAWVVLLVAVFLLINLFRSFRQVNQWEVALKFTMGRFSGLMTPGLNLLAPLFQSMVRIDTRIRNRDLPRQMVITRDNVTAAIDAVVYYKVVDPVKAALNVENFELAVKDRAKVVLRDVVGEISLDDLLAHRDEVATRVRAAVEQFVAQWGLHVELIALQDIQLPPAMQEVIAKKAIGEREKQWVILKSQADVESARNFAEAARILADAPGGLELRRLEALQNLTAQGVSKVIFDLAKPYDHPSGGSSRAAAMAMAMSDGETTGIRAEPGAGQMPVAPQQMAQQATPITADQQAYYAQLAAQHAAAQQGRR